MMTGNVIKLILRYYPLTFYAAPPTLFNSFLPHLP